jgi:ElaB/YqjD/DUF883 family membrane-anchored ribosome-binding protein
VEMLNKATARVQGVVHKAADAAAPAARWLGERRGTVTAGAAKVLDRTGKYVGAHPLQSLGLALVAGYLISRLTR